METSYYYPAEARREKDGTVLIRVSIYSDTEHSSGEVVRDPTHTDYDFWLFLIHCATRGEEPQPWCIDSEALKQKKEEYNQALQLLGPQLVDRAAILDALPMVREPSRTEQIVGAIFFFFLFRVLGGIAIVLSVPFRGACWIYGRLKRLFTGDDADR